MHRTQHTQHTYVIQYIHHIPAIEHGMIHQDATQDNVHHDKAQLVRNTCVSVYVCVCVCVCVYTNASVHNAHVTLTHLHTLTHT